MPGAGQKVVDGISVGQQTGCCSNCWQTTSLWSLWTKEAGSDGSDGDEASSLDAHEVAEPEKRPDPAIDVLVEAQVAANVLQAMGRCVLCTDLGANRETSHSKERSDTTGPR